ncbi:hypothetical protein BDZ90DRAFT_229199 [Jaminaea rosea]|uniref:HCP-like protein n=1 Tax=Jaminaea rosea TaxID=1569628 RepID=A0A316V0V0_9BASI|nr:hypothetical protein BDZ90DRAFT_229199 [Jaminaea rosea]PWN30171.1 hypothetical protein BDZ90DRAFT_229199 [Jaminaea rosea]
MTSTASPSHASPAHSYHNRFANEGTISRSTSAAAPEKAEARSESPSATTPFSFDFSEFKGLDGGNEPALGSFLSYQQAQQKQTDAAPAAAPAAAPPAPSMPAPQPPSHLETSQDVAALEAAVDKQESDEAAQDQPKANSGGDGDDAPIAPSAQPAPLPRPPVVIDPVESPTPAADQSQVSSREVSQPSIIPSSSSARSLSKSPIGNFSRPSNLVPSSQSTASNDSGLERGIGSLDLNGGRDRDRDGEGRHNDMPQLRSVQAQQPILSPGGAGDDTSSKASATAFPSSETEELAPSVVPRQNMQERERPSSFFGLQGPPASARQSAIDQQQNVPSADDSGSGFFGGAASGSGTRPSSFFALNNSEPTSAIGSSQSGGFHRDDSGLSAPGAQNRSTLAGGTGNAAIQHSGSFNFGSGNGRPASIAPSVTTGPLLDHSHLKPGEQAALLSHNKTLELYRQNAKKTNDPDLIYEFAVFMIDASKSMPESPSGAVGIASGSKEDVIKEAIGLLKKIAERGHADAQYFLADCYANGIGTPKAKQDFDRAYPLFVLAAKHGHPDAAYRAGTCYEKGWGCRRDQGKALQFYRKAASQNHPGAMYRLATAELNGELGLKRSAKEGVKWLKRSADAATPEFPHALHELALLHERGIDNVLFVDPEYSCELLAQAGEMGYAPSAYKLGVNYEYGRMGCPQDAGLSIHMYNIAAQQNHKEACFALTAWYLVGAPSILPQSDTEAYLWAKKAAEQNLAKAEYAVGYFTEMGIGTVKDLKEAKEWYKRAAEHGDKRANQRLTGLGGRPVGPLPGVGAGGAGGAGAGGAGGNKAGQHGQTPGGSDYASMPVASRTQPTNAPFPSRVEVSAMSPSTGGSGTMFPSPLTMRDTQSAMREERYLANVAAAQQAEYRSTNPQQRPPPQQQQQRSMTGPSSGAPSGYSNGVSGARPPPQQFPPQPRPPQNGLNPYAGPHRSGSMPPPPGAGGYNGVGPSPAHSAASAYPTYSAPSGPGGSPSSPGRPPPINTSFLSGGSPTGQQHSAPPQSYPSYGHQQPHNGQWRPSPPPGQQQPGAGMTGPRPPQSNAPNMYSSPMMSPPMQPGMPGGPGRPNGPGMMSPNSGPGGMPFSFDSDDATAAQIFQRAQQQQQQNGGASNGGDQQQQQQPKKKKGWFGGSK